MNYALIRDALSFAARSAGALWQSAFDWLRDPQSEEQCTGPIHLRAAEQGPHYGGGLGESSPGTDRHHRRRVGHARDGDGCGFDMLGVPVMYGLDRSWAVRAEGTGVRIACSNLLYAGMNTPVELREVHLSSATDLLAMLQKAIHAILSRFKDALRVYEDAMGEEMLAEEVAPALLAAGPPRSLRRFRMWGTWRSPLLGRRR